MNPFLEDRYFDQNSNIDNEVDIDDFIINKYQHVLNGDESESENYDYEDNFDENEEDSDQNNDDDSDEYNENEQKY